MTARVFVGLGSNIGDPVAQVTGALALLAGLPATQLLGHSSLYRTTPVGAVAQPDFVNAVAELTTGLEPLALLDGLQRIERDQGRVRGGERWGPRTLDLDLLLYGDTVVSVPQLQIPHPEMYRRAFVLVPLQELAGDLVIPGAGAVSGLLEALPDTQQRQGVAKIG